jgi:hypothetical protein
MELSSELAKMTDQSRHPELADESAGWDLAEPIALDEHKTS